VAALFVRDMGRDICGPGGEACASAAAAGRARGGALRLAAADSAPRRHCHEQRFVVSLSFSADARLRFLRAPEWGVTPMVSTLSALTESRCRVQKIVFSGRFAAAACFGCCSR
jgi:hypothetical protein